MNLLVEARFSRVYDETFMIDHYWNASLHYWSYHHTMLQSQTLRARTKNQDKLRQAKR